MPDLSLSVNGRMQTVDVDPEMPLLWALRDALGLIGTKFGCGGGFCGACTVHVDGVATRSCTLPVGKVAGRAIVTTSKDSAAARRCTPCSVPGSELDVAQCGYCQAGQIMTAAALLARTPNPTDEQIDDGMNGNLCRCGTYMRIRDAVRRAAALSTGTASGGER